MTSLLDPLPIASMVVLAFNAIKPSIQEQLGKVDESNQFIIQKILRF